MPNVQFTIPDDIYVDAVGAGMGLGLTPGQLAKALLKAYVAERFKVDAEILLAQIDKAPRESGGVRGPF